MISPLNPSSQMFLTALNRADDRLLRAERQITSGLKINSPSDDPERLPALLQDRVEVAMAGQSQTDLGRVKSEVSTAEQALESAVTVLEQIRTLGAQGASEIISPQQRSIVAAQVDALFGQLVSLTGTSVEGRNVFSGDSDHTAPYAVDPAGVNGATDYAGSASTRKVLDVTGSAFPVARTAQEIFDNPTPGASVFAAVAALRTALENTAGDPFQTQTDNITAALAAVGTAQDHLNSEVGYYGTVGNRLDEAIGFAAKLEVQRKADLSSIGDADIAAAILELNQATTQRQAALQAHAKIPQSTLFDYLG